MSPLTFEFIIDLVEQNMAKTITVFLKTVPIEKTCRSKVMETFNWALISHNEQGIWDWEV